MDRLRVTGYVLLVGNLLSAWMFWGQDVSGFNCFSAGFVACSLLYPEP